jgi:hypothetical protein
MKKKLPDALAKVFHKNQYCGEKNMKLHIQHVPRRYWKYLTEKH